MPIKVVACDCRHEYQDRVYGPGQRVHNVAPKAGPNKSRALRCTVCRKVKAMAEGKDA